jgi:hypothetical protein
MARMKKVIDAEFEVVSAPRHSEAPASWNGLGVPPQWRSWNIVGKVFYVVTYAAWMLGLILLHQWLWVNWVKPNG